MDVDDDEDEDEEEEDDEEARSICEDEDKSMISNRVVIWHVASVHSLTVT